MDFIKKIARLITEDPDLFNESERYREAERSASGDPGDRESILKQRREAERGQYHGTVSTEQLLDKYTEAAGDAIRMLDGEDEGEGDGAHLPSQSFADNWFRNRSNYQYALASDLMEYAPNFKRNAIYRICQLVEELWMAIGKTKALRIDIESIYAIPSPRAQGLIDAFINYLADGSLADTDGGSEAFESTEAELSDYLDSQKHRAFSVRRRLNRFLSEEDDPGIEDLHKL